MGSRFRFKNLIHLTGRSLGNSDSMDTQSSSKVPNFKLREAHKNDYCFAKRLYIQTMKPLMMKLGAWDEAAVIAKFNDYYKLGEVQIISIDGNDAGWLQISESKQELELAQIHIEQAFCCQGIGTKLIQKLMNEAQSKGKSVCLSVVRGNRALSLYRRFQFKIIGDDKHKIHMRWDND